MFELPDIKGITEVVINEETVLKGAEPLMIFEKVSDESASAS